MNTNEGVWLSINDYSRFKNVSISTIRRHIKNNILKHKEENGKYFIYFHSSERIQLKEEEELLRVKLELELLRRQLKELSEENGELRMLINLYEKPKNNWETEQPPELPQYI
jgi:hypothetical protein